MSRPNRRYDPNFYMYGSETLAGAVEVFLTVGGDPNGSYDYDRFSMWKQSPLYFAVKTCSAAAVRLLLAAGADPNKRTNAALASPLHFACRSSGQDSIEIALMLLDYGADLLATDDIGCTAVHHAFYARNSTLVELLLARLPRGTNRADVRDLSVFHIACAHGADWIVRELLDRGVDIDHYTENSWFRVQLNGLQFAIIDNRQSTVELLLEAGADVNSATTAQETLLHLACECNMEKFAMSWNGHSVVLYDDLSACERSHLGIVDALLDHERIDVNAASEIGLTALLHSCSYQVMSTMAWRTSLAFLDDCSMTGMEELMIARRRLVVRRLLERGADVGRCDLSGRGALHSLFDCNSTHELPIDAATMGLLLERGADVNGRDEHLMTPLHLVCAREINHGKPGHAAVTARNVELLLRHGANANARSADGHTPLGVCLLKSCNGDAEQIARCEHLGVLLAHVRRLLALGLSLDREIVAYLAERQDHAMEAECAEELARMREARVDGTSLYRLLRSGLDRAGGFLDENRLREIKDEFALEERYPHYAYLLEVRVRRARLLKRAESALKMFASYELPRLCSEAIFKYLTDLDLKYLADIASTKRNTVDPAQVESAKKKG